MTRVTLALVSALAFSGLTLPAYAAPAVGDWEPGPNNGQQAEDMHAPLVPEYGGGWPAGVSGESGGGFEARSATPEYGGGEPPGMTGEAGGSFNSATGTPLGAQDNGKALSAVRSAEAPHHAGG